MHRGSVLLSTVVSTCALVGCGNDDIAGPGGYSPSCGNGMLDSGEVCDVANLNGRDCEALDFGPGVLACGSGCTAFDRAGCGAPLTCGNGSVQAPEVCDGLDVGGATCEGLGFGPGMLGCARNCAELDSSGCGAPPTCANGQLDANETCDGNLLRGASCSSLGLGSGDLACDADCLDYDVGGCSCVPLSCNDVGAECGSIDTGCGGTVSCGSCGGGLTCGGGGTDNVCGAPCPGGCPSGSTCSGAGTCTSVDLTGLVLDVPTVQVSGYLTRNGVLPAQTPGCSGSADNAATVRFVERTHGYSLSATVWCDSGFTFGPVEIFPGTYTVSVLGDDADTDIPGEWYVAVDALLLDVDTTGLGLDVPTVDVSGSVTRNGTMPAQTAGCSGTADNAATVRFVETTYGYSLSATVWCDTNFVFGPASIFPGTYRVSVLGDDADTDIPGEWFVAEPSRSFFASATNVVLDVPTVEVSGYVTRNGGVPSQTAGCSGTADNAATVRFVESTYGYSLSATVWCDTGFVFGPASLFPGTYQVSVLGDDADTDIPGEWYVAIDSRSITSDTANLGLDVPTVDVSGSVTRNGAMPTQTAGCSGTADNAATVRFVETTYGYSLSATVWCDTNFVFGPASIFPGTYSVSVLGDDADTNIPGEWFVALPQRTLTSTTSGLVLDVPTVQVSGSVTRNGGTPTQTAGCSGTADNAATVRFVESTYGYSLSATVWCDTNFVFGPAEIFPGSYTVSVLGDDADTNIPGEWYVALEQRTFNTTTNGLILDVPTVQVSGRVTRNGAMPQETAGCSGTADNAATVRFVEVDQGYSLSSTVWCATSFTFGPAEIFPGVYSISVLGDDADTNIPGEWYVVYPRIELR